MELFSKAAFFSIDFKTLMIFSTIFLVLFAIAEIAYHFFNAKVEYTRKFVHLFTGLIALFFPIYIWSPLDLILLCSSFAVIVVLSIKFNFLKSVNAIDRSSRGSVLFPVVVIICYLFQYFMEDYSYFFIPILVLAFADPGAALVGKKWPIGEYSILGNLKTRAGTTAFIVIAFLICMGAFYLIEGKISFFSLIVSFFIAIVAAIGESMSIRGYDNLTIPLCCIGILLIFGI